jgi:integrase
MPKFVEGFVDKLVVPAGARDILVFDGGHIGAVAGFGIRKFASGKAYYIIKYSVAGKTRRLSLGEVTRGNLKAMRTLASEVKARGRVGQDVVAEKRAAAAKNAVTLGELVPKYLQARKDEVRENTYSEWERYLQQTWKPLHKHAIDAITRDTVVTIIDRLAHKVAADRARTALSALYSWAIDCRYLDGNPTLGIRSRAKGGSRTRVLTEAELIEIWRACLDDDHGRIVRLLILTGQRRAEVGNLRWSELDLEKRQVTLPEHRTKNGRAHIIPLGDEAVAILKGVAHSEGRELMFGRGAGGFAGWSKAKRELDGRIAQARGVKEKPMPPWTLHDLRRSFVTHISEHGFAHPHVVEAIVNHISGAKAGIAGVYNRASYLAEKRQALELWGAHIAELVDGKASKFVPLRRTQ